MKTLICQQPGVMEYVEKDIPTPADNEVLLKIKAVGICGTDIHAFAGRQPVPNSTIRPALFRHPMHSMWRVRSLSGKENELLRTCFAVWRASGWGL